MGILTERERRDPESREWWQGWWECTVHWLEVQDGTTALLEREETFYSPEEQAAYMKVRVEGGWVYDISWSHEVSLGGKGHPKVGVLSDRELEQIVGEFQKKGGAYG